MRGKRIMIYRHCSSSYSYRVARRYPELINPLLDGASGMKIVAGNSNLNKTTLVDVLKWSCCVRSKSKAPIHQSAFAFLFGLVRE